MNSQISKRSLNPRLLYVEDDEDSCAALASLLRMSNYDVVTANTVAEGLRLAQEEAFDLIILDNWFKQSSGVELCRRIREFNSEIPILFYSAAGYETDISSGMGAGADDYIVKPDFEQFKQSLVRLLSLGHRRRS
ncbi:MAG TPA: response regulator [Blastocatellia bacterium]|nr:response regulator [Blastocatellia bacterium]